MATYFFDMTDVDERLIDEDGREIPNIEAVKSVAIGEARSIISHDAKEGVIDMRLSIAVRDEQGLEVHRLAFSDAVSAIEAVGRAF